MNSNSDKPAKVIVAVTGASGALYARETLRQLIALDQVKNIALVFSENGSKVWDYEKVMDIPVSSKIEVFENHDLFAAPSSGSAGYRAMFIVPCSMGTLAAVASGLASTLIQRAADVQLKERKTLVCMTREAPLSLIHIENMEKVTRTGGVIFPASPFFYHHPKDIHSAVSALVSRMLNVAGLSAPEFEWGKD